MRERLAQLKRFELEELQYQLMKGMDVPDVFKQGTTESQEVLAMINERKANLRAELDADADVQAAIGAADPKEKGVIDHLKDAGAGIAGAIDTASDKVLSDKLSRGQKRAITYATIGAALLIGYLLTRGKDSYEEGEEAARSTKGGWFKKLLVGGAVAAGVFFGGKYLIDKYYDNKMKELEEAAKKKAEEAKKKADEVKDKVEEGAENATDVASLVLLEKMLPMQYDVSDSLGLEDPSKLIVGAKEMVGLADSNEEPMQSFLDCMDVASDTSNDAPIDALLNKLYGDKVLGWTPEALNQKRLECRFLLKYLAKHKETMDKNAKFAGVALGTMTLRKALNSSLRLAASTGELGEQLKNAAKDSLANWSVPDIDYDKLFHPEIFSNEVKRAAFFELTGQSNYESLSDSEKSEFSSDSNKVVSFFERHAASTILLENVSTDPNSVTNAVPAEWKNADESLKDEYKNAYAIVVNLCKKVRSQATENKVLNLLMISENPNERKTGDEKAIAELMHSMFTDGKLTIADALKVHLLEQSGSKGKVLSTFYALNLIRKYDRSGAGLYEDRFTKLTTILTDAVSSPEILTKLGFDADDVVELQNFGKHIEAGVMDKLWSAWEMYANMWEHNRPIAAIVTAVYGWPAIPIGYAGGKKAYQFFSRGRWDAMRAVMEAGPSELAKAAKGAITEEEAAKLLGRLQNLEGQLYKMEKGGFLSRLKSIPTEREAGGLARDLLAGKRTSRIENALKISDDAAKVATGADDAAKVATGADDAARITSGTDDVAKGTEEAAQAAKAAEAGTEIAYDAARAKQLMEEIKAARAAKDNAKLAELLKNPMLRAAAEHGDDALKLEAQALLRASKWATGAKIAGKGLIVLGVAVDAYLIWDNEQQINDAKKKGQLEKVQVLEARRQTLAVSGAAGTGLLFASAPVAAIGLPVIIAGSIYADKIYDSINKFEQTSKEWMKEDPMALRARLSELEIGYVDAGRHAGLGEPPIWRFGRWIGSRFSEESRRGFEEVDNERFRNLEEINSQERREILAAYFLQHLVVNKMPDESDDVFGERVGKIVSDQLAYVRSMTDGTYHMDGLSERFKENAVYFSEMMELRRSRKAQNLPMTIEYEYQGAAKTLDLSTLHEDRLAMDSDENAKDRFFKAVHQYETEVKPQIIFSRMVIQASLVKEAYGAEGKDKEFINAMVRAEMMQSLYHSVYNTEERIRELRVTGRRNVSYVKNIIRRSMRLEAEKVLSAMSADFQNPDGMTLEKFQSHRKRLEAVFFSNRDLFEIYRAKNSTLNRDPQVSKSAGALIELCQVVQVQGAALAMQEAA